MQSRHRVGAVGDDAALSVRGIAKGPLIYRTLAFDFSLLLFLPDVTRFV